VLAAMTHIVRSPDVRRIQRLMEEWNCKSEKAGRKMVETKRITCIRNKGG
jgi:hypothetical protein